VEGTNQAEFAMSPVEPLWSTKRWITTISLFLAAHFFMAFALGKRRSNPAPESISPISFRYFGSERAEPRLLLKVSASDPSLFVLPSPNGFSGQAWMNVSRPDGSPAAWVPPVPALGLEETDLGHSVVDAIQRLLPESPRTAQKAIGPMARLEQYFPGETLPKPESTFEFTAANGIQLSSPPPALPIWTNAEPLAPVKIEVGLDETGLVHASRLLSKSGLQAADMTALRWSENLRFEPPRGSVSGELAWSLVTIHWFTRAPGATNNVPSPSLIPSP
jgi:hypothetical protein